jgi:hypothetical protein
VIAEIEVSWWVSVNPYPGQGSRGTATLLVADRTKGPFAALHESVAAQVFGPPAPTMLTTRSGGRRPKSAKARNRGGGS